MRSIRTSRAAVCATLAVIALTAPVRSTHAQSLPSAKALLEKEAAALGRAEMEKHTSVHRTLTSLSDGKTYVQESFRTKPNLWLNKTRGSGLPEILLGFDGETAWTGNAGESARAAEGMTVPVIKSGADFFHEFYDPTFKSAETLEIANFEGQRCYKVRIVRDGNNGARGPGDVEEIAYLDSATGLRAGHTTTSGQGREKRQTSVVMGDYKEFAGVKVATRYSARYIDANLPKEFTDRPNVTEITAVTFEFDHVDPTIYTLPGGALSAAVAAAVAAQRTEKRETEGHLKVADVTQVTDSSFVWIQPGTFQMGDAGDADVPVHPVTLTRGFWMQKSEVTQAQWSSVMQKNPSATSECGRVCPVESVSYDDVQGFLDELNVRYPGKHYRLPTEAEWEYAARAGTTGNHGTPGAVTFGGWIDANSDSTTHPVASLRPNAWGLYDMEGNVWEWVNDWLGPYATSPSTDPTGPRAGDKRVIRGGSWFGPAADASSANRQAVPPGTRDHTVGFRLVRDP